MSRYVNHDAAGWVARNTRKPMSKLGQTVAHIIGISCGGIYNAVPKPTNVDWSSERYIQVSIHHGLSTYDFNELTNLVFLCHEARVRLSILQSSPGRVALGFSPRRICASMAEHHPNLDEAVATLRSWLPADHPLVWRGPDIANA